MHYNSKEFKINNNSRNSKYDFRNHIDPPLWQDVTLVFGVVFMWAAVYVNFLLYRTAEISGILSFSTTRFVIFPIIIYDLVIRYNSYRNIIPEILMAIALGVCMLYPVIRGNTIIAHLLPYAVSAAVFLYFYRGRTVERLVFLLKVIILCCAVVPLMQFLGSLELVPILKGGDDALKTGAEGRVFSVTRTATVGIFSLYCVSFLGGILLFDRNWRTKKINYIIILVALPAIVLGVIAPIYAVQRASIVPVLTALIICSIFILYKYKRYAILMVPVVALFLMSILFVLRSKITDFTEKALQRFDGLALGDTYLMEGSAYFRVVELQIMKSDLLLGFPFAPGIIVFLRKVGNVAHTFVAQAFYDGGLYFVTLVCAVYGYTLWTIIAIIRSNAPALLKLLGYQISVICLGVMFISIFLPVLQEPLFWLSFSFLFVAKKHIVSKNVNRVKFHENSSINT